MNSEIRNILNPQTKVQQFTLSGEVKEEKMMITKLGYLPLSIFEIDWKQTKVLKEYVGDISQGRSDTTSVIAYQKSAGSIFNPYLCKSLLRGYAPKTANIYDPFAGGGTRAIISTAMGHKYTGCEIRKEEVDNVNERGKTLGLDFTLLHKDSRDFVDKEAFDFSLTCPPYYNMEQYHGGENDLSMAPTYERFMEDIDKVMENVYASLKPDSYCIWVVGNLRHNNTYLIDFRGDVVRSAGKAGFIFHDDIVIHSAAGNAVQRVGRFEANKKSVRIHEYALIFKKL